LFTKTGAVYEVNDCCEILKVKDATILAEYQEDFYANTPAVTVKNHGTGNAYYVAARIHADVWASIYTEMLENAGITAKALDENIEYHVRSGEEGTYEFYLNLSKEPVTQENVQGFNLVTEENVTGTLCLEGYGVAVIKRENA